MIHPDKYPIESGDIAIDPENIIGVQDYETHFQEIQVSHSTALQSRRMPSKAEYFVGPMARMFYNQEKLTPQAKLLADQIGFDARQNNPHQSILARAIETVFAFEEALGILKTLSESPLRDLAPQAPYSAKAGTGQSVTEAPRGLIFHQYSIDEQGHVEFAKIVPPTSQNQARIEADLRLLLSQIHTQSDGSIAQACERLVRTYDPCISCSTHFLKVKIDRL